MPEYSTLAGQRDVFGELGWVPNFEIKKSKNNEDRHVVYRELFDAPKDYNTEFHTATMTNTEFFRQNAPSTSVANLNADKSLTKTLKSSRASFAPADHRKSYNPIDRLAFSAGRRSSKLANRSEFVLYQDTTNRHRISSVVHNTVALPNSIPFLRDIRNVSN